jgi:hypothetical protein
MPLKQRLIVFVALLCGYAYAADNGSTTASPSCGVPIDPPGQPVVDAAAEVGVWYEYMFYTPGLDEANCVTNYTYLGRINDPRGPGLSYLYNHTTTFYLLPGLNCMGVNGLSNFTTSGKRYATFFFPPVLEQMFHLPHPLQLNFTVFHADANWEFFYYCGQPNFATGLCDIPNLFVKTRLYPTKLDQYLKDSIAQTVSQILKPWCMSLKDLSLFRESLTVPLQCLITPADGYSALVQAAQPWILKV